MDFIGFIIDMLVIGLIAGAAARFLVPGRDPMSLGTTWVVGAVGSLVGGFLGYLLFRTDGEEGWFQPAGLIGSISGAVIVVLLYRQMQKRSVTPCPLPLAAPNHRPWGGGYVASGLPSHP